MKGKDDAGKKKSAVEINKGDDQPLYDGRVWLFVFKNNAEFTS